MKLLELLIVVTGIVLIDSWLGFSASSTIVGVVVGCTAWLYISLRSNS